MPIFIRIIYFTGTDGVLPSSFLDQFSNSRSDKEDGKGSSQTRKGGSDFLILDSRRSIVRKRWGRKG